MGHHPASAGQGTRSVTNVKPQMTMATSVAPSPTATPTAPVDQRLAAVAVPRTDPFCFRMAPAADEADAPNNSLHHPRQRLRLIIDHPLRRLNEAARGHRDERKGPDPGAVLGALSVPAPVVRQIQAAGVTSLQGIADALNDRGIRTARGGAWHNSTVRNLLAREAAVTR